MANVQPELDKLAAAVYGEEMRAAFISSIQKMNEQAASAQEWATGEDDPTDEPSATNNAAYYAAQAAATASGMAAVDGAVSAAMILNSRSEYADNDADSGVIFTSADVSAGDTIWYDVTGPSGSAYYGYIQLFKSNGTGYTDMRYGKIDKTSETLHYTGSFVIPSDFSACKAVANGHKVVTVKYVARTLEKRVATLESGMDDIDRHFKMLPIGTYANGTRPFTNADVSPGDILHYKITIPAGVRNGNLVMRNSGGTAQALYRYEATYTGDNPLPGNKIGYSSTTTDLAEDTVYSGAVIVPADFNHAFVNCTTGYAITITELYVVKLYGEMLEHRIVQADLDIPSYYFAGNYLPGKAADINAKLDDCMAYGDAFMFVTDIHLYYATADHIGSGYNEFHTHALMSYIGKKTCINKVFLGGDLFHNGDTQEYALARTYTNLLHEGFGRKVLFTVGNHDMFAHNTASRITTWADAMNDDFNGNSRRHYYYIDNSRAKIRYIVLAGYYEATGGEGDDYDPGFSADADQRSWFANTALNMPAGWGAVVFIHDVYQYHYSGDKGLEIQPNGTKLLELCDAYNNNPESAGEIMAIVTGHTHCDRVLYHIYDEVNNKALPIIITTSDQNGGLGVVPNSAEYCDPDGLGSRVSGTIREQAFDVMVIDRRRDQNNEGTIYAIRVGCEAYDGTGMSISELGHATQMRTIHYPEKFTLAEITGDTATSINSRVTALENAEV